MNRQEQSLRLYQAIERLCMQAGTEIDETVDWLCGNHGGMHKLFDSFFGPKPAQRRPLTDEQLEAMAEMHVTDCYFDTLKFARAIEAAHGIKGQS